MGASQFSYAPSVIKDIVREALNCRHCEEQKVPAYAGMAGEREADAKKLIEMRPFIVLEATNMKVLNGGGPTRTRTWNRPVMSRRL